VKRWKENIWWVSWSVLLVAQIVLCIFFYNWGELDALVYIGWAILAVGVAIGYMGVNALRRKGGVPKGKSFIQTTVVVDGGIYAAVRHPQYLCWIFVSLALIFIAPYWVVVIIGVAAVVTIYMQARQDDRGLVQRFGNDYERYMQSVPRMNILVGVIRLLRRKTPGKGVSGG